MQKYNLLFFAMFFIFLFSSCNKAEIQENEMKSNADTTGYNIGTSPAAAENNKDSLHKFIRTADIKFKVKNVVSATYDIEEITNRNDGFVTHTSLSSNIDWIRTTPNSTDSSLETTYYTVANSLTLRVPNNRLDTTLKEISKNIDFLDHRIIIADDVSVQIISNSYARVRSAKYEKRLTTAIDTKGIKLNDITNAEDLLQGKQESADYTKLSDFTLHDKIKYSTVTLNIYQPQTFKTSLMPNEIKTKEYEPAFRQKIAVSILYGWKILEVLIVSLLKLWPLFLLAGLFYYLSKSKKFRNNKLNRIIGA